MKKVITAFLILSILITSAAASDVAYIYRRQSKIDSSIIQAFNDKGLTVDLINERTLPINFDNYKLLFVGDEKLRKAEQIPINNFPSILATYYHTNLWGLTKNSVSKLGSTRPLSIIQNNKIIQVYTQALQKNRISLSYYYLHKRNKAPALQQIAAVQTTSSGYKIGDVISYADKGAQLANGKTQNGNLCFFGIVESDFWTPEAKELFNDCIDFVIPTQPPAPEPPQCQDNTDCPNQTISEPFCQDNNVYETQTTYTCEENQCIPNITDILIEECEFSCENAQCLEEPEQLQCTIDDDCGLPSSELVCDNNNLTNVSFVPLCVDEQCSGSAIFEVIEICDYGCENAQCLPEPPPAENHDIALIDSTGAVNKIKIETLDGEVILGNELTCSEYNVFISVKNNGNFTENVTFQGNVGYINFSHIKITNLAPEETKDDKKRKVDFALPQGFYNITIEAIIDGFTDVNPSDNTAQREIYISC